MTGRPESWYCRQCDVTITEPDTPTDHFVRYHSERPEGAVGAFRDTAQTAPDPGTSLLSTWAEERSECEGACTHCGGRCLR